MMASSTIMASSTMMTGNCSSTYLFPLLPIGFRHGNSPQFRRPLFTKRSSFSALLSAPGFPYARAHITAAESSREKIIDGKAVAREIREEVAAEVSRMKETVGVVPGLAVILVGDKKESVKYVDKKKEACRLAGIVSNQVYLSDKCGEEEVVQVISRFNEDPSVHGILVQLPLPLHMNEERILNAIDIKKDVDGFHPENMGNLAMRKGQPLFVPCTPKGCLELLHRYGVEIAGKNAVVIGRSSIAGLPAALLLQREDATVTSVHSKTKNVEDIVRQADIVISAAGKAGLVKGSWIKPGAVVIDIGINDVEGRMVGDVCFKEVMKVASAVTPVPGGVGPMTVAMLLSNTLTAAKRAHNFH